MRSATRRPVEDTLIYDPANTDTTGTMTNTTGPASASSGGSVTADSANSIIRRCRSRALV